MTIEQDPVEHGKGGDSQEAPTQVVRATSRAPRSTSAAPTIQNTVQGPAANVTTAELPAVRAGAAPVTGPRSRYSDPRPPGRARHRDPAPVGLRVLVWVLVLVFLVALSALVTVRVHPTWLSFMRNSDASVSTGPVGSPTSTTVAPTGMTLESSIGSSATYSVPTPTFTLYVTVPGRCYIQVTSPTDATNYIYAHTTTSAANPTQIAITAGSAKVTFAAQVSSIEVRSGARLLGTIGHPSDSVTYVFNSTAPNSTKG